MNTPLWRPSNNERHSQVPNFVYSLRIQAPDWADGVLPKCLDHRVEVYHRRLIVMYY